MQITVGYKIVILLLFYTWARKLVSHIEGRTQGEGQRENGAEEHICTYDGGSQMNLEKLVYGTDS